MKALAFAMMLCAAATLAHARDAEGRLDLVLAPNSAQPAILQRGAELTVTLREEAELRLESAAGTYPLGNPVYSQLHGTHDATVTIGPDVAAGTYTLVAKTATKEDRNFRSVVVLDAPLDVYKVAVWNDLRVSADLEHPDTSLFRVTDEINANNAALVIVTGDLTASGAPEQFRLALDVLNDCHAPTLVAPGPADLASGRAGEYLGAYPLAVPFGLDAYLLCPRPLSTLGGEPGRLHLERRRIRAARWSVGVAPGMELGDLREQLTVLVDDPLDAILGAPAAFVSEAGGKSPWGRTRVYTVPAQASELRWYTVTPQSISAAKAP